MTNIFLKINGASASATADGKLTSGMVGVPVNIEYNEEWNGLTKNVVFRVGGFSRVRRNAGTSTTVPWEVLRIQGGFLSIGIDGRNETGDVVIPTVWATVGKILPGANGEIPAAPNPGNDEPGGSYGSTIDDSQVSLAATWSSKKIGDLIDSVAENARDGLELVKSEFKHDLSLAVKSVNGITPDENGNVQIETGGSVDLSNYYTKEEIDQLATGLYENWGIDDLPSKAYVHEEALATAESVVNREIGDISVALYELHAYAEALKGGGAV